LRQRGALPLQRGPAVPAARREAEDVDQVQGKVMSGEPSSARDREQAVRDWERGTDGPRLDRQFSGERLKRVVSGDWLTKLAFVVGTGAVIFFILTHGGKEERAQKKEARAAEQIDEPSVRDFRPPVMPVRLATAQASDAAKTAR